MREESKEECRKSKEECRKGEEESKCKIEQVS